jgi:tetratricopeptide (TPR) repeat protein
MPGRLPDAIAQFEAALRINPNFAEAHNNLGIALASTGRGLPEAVTHFETALRINPGYAQASANLRNALSLLHAGASRK